VPVIGTQGSPYLQAGDWQTSFGYRYFKSHRHFVGDHEDTQRADEHSEVINQVNLLDFGIAHAFTQRYGATLALPVLFATRSTPIRNSANEVIDRDLQRTDAIGDMVLSGTAWLLDPETFLGGNVKLGLGVKFPTGQDDVRHTATVRNGNTYTREERTVDQSIQPGDGSFGFVLGVEAFYLLLEKYTLFYQSLYLFNPRNTNGVPTFRTTSGEEVMSVTDQFVGRAGVGVPIPLIDKYGFSFSIAGRLEGVPVRDAFGADDGFRRPGITISVEPGISWSRYGHTVGLSAPIAVYRNRWQSVPDKEAEPERHGDAAFADWSLVFSWSYNFGSGSKPDDTRLPEVPVLPDLPGSK
jgi:hypothetical protein